MPIPGEHGAWVILYAPLLAGLGMGRSFPTIPALLLILAVTGLYLARHAAALILRRRGDNSTATWLAVYLTGGVVGGVLLLSSYHDFALIPIAGIAGGLFLAHSTLVASSQKTGLQPKRTEELNHSKTEGSLRRLFAASTAESTRRIQSLVPKGRRADRSEWGEVIGVAGLVLTGPAGCVVARGSMDERAWMLWIACTLYYSSAIFFVKMLLAAVRGKQEMTRASRLRVGRPNLVYHLGLGVAVSAAAFLIGGRSGALVAAGYIPILLRGIRGTFQLSHHPPKLKRVGIAESIYAAWFTACLVAASRW